MVSFMTAFVIFGAIILNLCTCASAQLQCYSCRGSDCTIPLEEHVRTCDLNALRPVTTPGPLDPTTDSDMNFDTSFIQAVDYPLLETLEESFEIKSTGLELVSSSLPGERFIRRILQQARDDGVRCFYSTYIDEESGEMETVRDCALLAGNFHNTCLSHVSGELISCYVCDEDLCNSATRVATSTLLVAAIVTTMWNAS